MSLKREYTDLEIHDIVRKVDGAMAQEGMSLTKDEKQIIRNCLSGKSTFEKERNKIISECRKIYG